MSIITPEEYINDLMEEMRPKFEQHTCAIFATDKRDLPDQIGSGVFLTHNNQHYLLSAAHTIDNALNVGEPLFFNDYTNLIELRGEMLKTRANRKDADDVDIAIINIDEWVNELQGISFITKELTTCNRTFSESSMYFIYGHPNSKNKQVSSIDRESKNFRLTGYTHVIPLEKEADFRKYHKHPAIHIAVYYGKKTIQKTPVVKNIGMSGGGLWIVPNIHSEIKPYYLSGICIEPHRPLVFATKIEVVFEILEQCSGL